MTVALHRIPNWRSRLFFEGTARWFLNSCAMVIIKRIVNLVSLSESDPSKLGVPCV